MYTILYTGHNYSSAIWIVKGEEGGVEERQGVWRGRKVELCSEIKDVMITEYYSKHTSLEE